MLHVSPFLILTPGRSIKKRWKGNSLTFFLSIPCMYSIHSIKKILYDHGMDIPNWLIFSPFLDWSGKVLSCWIDSTCLRHTLSMGTLIWKVPPVLWSTCNFLGVQVKEILLCYSWLTFDLVPSMAICCKLVSSNKSSTFLSNHCLSMKTDLKHH